jgi:hypothetical protein
MVRIFENQKRPNSSDQRMGFYIGLPSIRRVLFIVLVVLPLCLFLWCVWTNALNFWLVELDNLVEPEVTEVSEIK